MPALFPVNNSIVVSYWVAGNTYPMYAVTAGLLTGGQNLASSGPPYWSTIDGNVGHNPSGQFIYPALSYNRSSDLTTVTIDFTGTYPQFARGSLYAITGMPDPSFNCTGMVLYANSGSVGTSVLQFINPGPDSAGGTTTVGALNCPEPSWTSGFFWSPTYSSQWDEQQAVIRTQFEPGYSQRSPQSANSNTTIWTLQFNDRGDTEVKGIMVYVQALAGVYATQLMIPPNRLFNNPSLIYVLSNPKVITKSYGLSDITVVATQVFGS